MVWSPNDPERERANNRRVLTIVAGVLTVGLLVDAVYASLGERHFFSALFANLAALTLYWTGVFGSFGLGAWAGISAANRWGRAWLGWVLGIIVFVAFGFSVGAIAPELPGVGWRYEAIQKAREEAREHADDRY